MDLIHKFDRNLEIEIRDYIELIVRMVSDQLLWLENRDVYKHATGERPAWIGAKVPIITRTNGCEESGVTMLFIVHLCGFEASGIVGSIQIIVIEIVCC